MGVKIKAALNAEDAEGAEKSKRIHVGMGF